MTHATCFFTKSEVVKFRAMHTKAARETISDELKTQGRASSRAPQKLGARCRHTVLLRAQDVKNIIELYNERINIYTTRIQAACKAMHAMQNQLEKLETKLCDIDEKYAKKRESEEKAYARGTPAMNKLRLRYIRRQRADEPLQSKDRQKRRQRRGSKKRSTRQRRT